MALASMGNQTLAAILNAFHGIGKAAAAAFAQGEKRTIAEKAIEIFGMCSGMTREVFAIYMSKKSTSSGF